MPSPTYYVQECPTCGRRLQIRVEYLGRRLVCQHCQGSLIAADPAMRCDCGNQLLKRADELLASVPNRHCQSRLPHPR
jgi:hypothetical protein